MGTKLRTVSVRLDDQAGARVSKAAELVRQSKGSFLASAGEAAAEKILLDWAQRQWEAGEASIGELAEETGIPFEAIEQYISGQRSAMGTKMYLASARRLAELHDDPAFYEAAKRAVGARLAQEANSADSD